MSRFFVQLFIRSYSETSADPRSSDREEGSYSYVNTGYTGT